MNQEDTSDSPVVGTSHPCGWCGSPLLGMAEYCCEGCESAAKLVSSAGLEQYFREREQSAPRPGVPVRGWEQVPLQSAGPGMVQAQLGIDGLRCASCVWVTERILEATPGVHRAGVSYATGRAWIEWDPEKANLEQIASRISRLGYRPRPVTELAGWDRELLLKLGVAAFAAMNMMSLAAGVYLGWWSGMDERFAALFRWIQLVLATPVALWCAIPFYRGAIQGLQSRVLHMDLPVSIGVLVLFGHGVFSTLRGEDAYLDSLGMLVGLLLAGRLLEQRGRARAAEAASMLAGEIPRVVRRELDGRIEEVDPATLSPGDLIRAVSGEELGADGVVDDGEAQLRMAILTGEAEPVRVRPGCRVVAGAAVLEGSIRVRVEAVGAESLVGRMARLVGAQQDRVEEPTPTDKIAPYFTAATLVVATLTFLFWLPLGPSAALQPTIAVLVVACPCALALSAPLAAAAGLGAAARRGVLLRGGSALRRLATIERIAIDKTGTLTQGELTLDHADPQALAIAAALERHSLHPIARAIVAAAAIQGIPLDDASEVTETPGQGISGTLNGTRWHLSRGEKAGEISLHSADQQFTLRLRDHSRPNIDRTIRQLKELGLPITVLSGDHQDAANKIRDELSADEALGGQSPEDKAIWLTNHPKTLFAGDGLNDGPALKTAHIGLAMQGGAAPSLLVADGITQDIAGLPAAIYAARFTQKAVLVGIYRSLSYNVLAVTAAALGLVNPLVAAVLMPLSSGMVIWSANRIEQQVAQATTQRKSP